MPSFVRPMLATSIEKPFDSDEWLYEVKWDGYRSVAFLENGKLRLVSRNDNDMTALYPELANLPTAIVLLDAVAVVGGCGLHCGGHLSCSRFDDPVCHKL